MNMHHQYYTTAPRSCPYNTDFSLLPPLRNQTSLFHLLSCGREQGAHQERHLLWHRSDRLHPGVWVTFREWEPPESCASVSLYRKNPLISCSCIWGIIFFPITFKLSCSPSVSRGDYEYELTLCTDTYTKKHTQWFYFRVRNMEAGVTYRFSIVNLMKRSCLYSLGMKPLFYSERAAKEEGVGWQRIGSNIRYYRNCSQVSEPSDSGLSLVSRSDLGAATAIIQISLLLFMLSVN